MNTYNTELYHFGVKGMKWGVRKSTYLQTVRVGNNISYKNKNPYWDKTARDGKAYRQYLKGDKSNRKAYKSALKKSKGLYKKQVLQNKKQYYREIQKNISAGKAARDTALALAGSVALSRLASSSKYGTKVRNGAALASGLLAGAAIVNASTAYGIKRYGKKTNNKRG